MPTSETYEQRAADCLKVAKETNDPAARPSSWKWHRLGSISPSISGARIGKTMAAAIKSPTTRSILLFAAAAGLVALTVLFAWMLTSA